MFDFIIYDFDGTISDTYPVFTEALVELARRHGETLEYKTAYDQLKVSVGYALAQHDFDGISKKQASHEFHNIHQEIARVKQKAFPQAAEILKFAKDHGKRNYIYTHTGKFVFELLTNMEILDLFDFVLDGSYDFPRKPAPDALNFLVDKCGIYKSRALMVGDRDIDTGAAHNAGICGCLFDTEGYYPECKTDYYIKSLLDLKSII